MVNGIILTLILNIWNPVIVSIAAPNIFGPFLTMATHSQSMCCVVCCYFFFLFLVESAQGPHIVLDVYFGQVSSEV